MTYLWGGHIVECPPHFSYSKMLEVCSIAWGELITGLIQLEAIKKSYHYLFSIIDGLPLELQKLVENVMHNFVIKFPFPKQPVFPPGSPLLHCHPSILIAPGSDSKHHVYPGGLLIHTALNVKAACSLANMARKFLCKEERNILIAAHIIHDMAKAYLLIWQPNGFPLKEPRLEGTKAHHILILAELMCRAAPVQLIRTVGSIHIDGPDHEDQLLNYIRIAGELAERECNFKEITYGNKILEYFARTAEAIWWDTCVETEHVVKQVLAKTVCKQLNGLHLDKVRCTWVTNLIISSRTELELYHAMQKGENAFLKEVKRGVKELYSVGLLPIEKIFTT